jgi:hypothetical protein
MQAFTVFHGLLVLQVRTYDVVPITSSLGIVEFVPGTRPLKDAICAFVPEEVCSSKGQGAAVRHFERAISAQK